ncbi:MAG TPA: DUF2062 domain-containing protein [Leptospiraceae bacterium]|nr:DUF2062 domain-containing protein [Leptospiraceae bacterium]HMW03933.1 DUF2062 domain-containing protein [Leptospiraceae bacterium]HMX33152.1 DUF2062 domain-containing protein [Leptospiraceae bacterium]HMY29913.1 DUF2062 domain-containing protein [Leptospiraceae bacterium]HMZ67133.1 DUF2062 domain-containing protein [Leptospiraceae bacterium]
MIKSFLKNKVGKPIVNLLKQGITPEKISLCIALGGMLGVFPVLGSTMILCTIASFAFKLNLPLIQLISYLVYPLQILFLIPFIRFGEWVLNVPPFPISIEALVDMIKTDIWQTIVTFWDATMHGIFGWMIVACIMIPLLYFIFLPILKRIPMKGIKE